MKKSLRNIPDPEINCNSENIYCPSDDTYLIIDYFNDFIKENYFDGKELKDINNILDLGTGTGIIAIYLQLLKEELPDFTANIYASDILDDSIKCAKKNEELNKIDKELTFIKSDLFDSFPESLKNSFDIIIFNPPYLPSSKIVNQDNKKDIDLSWDGGKRGYEIFIRFLDESIEFLNRKSQCFIYFICSSRTNLKELEQIIKEKGFSIKILNKKHIFFEDIFLYRLDI
jgi:release factor glutamine methyltransferase